MTPFVLSFATPAKEVPTPAYGYSEERQVNLSSKGGLAAEDPAIVAVAGPTYSTAGTRTNADDTN